MSIAQIAGGFTGAAIAALFYYPHFKVTGPDEGNCVGIFATGPAIDNKPFNLISEIIATFMFMLAILCLGKMAEWFSTYCHRYFGSIHWYVLWCNYWICIKSSP